MEITFLTAALRRLCCSEEQMTDRWGHTTALLLAQRLFEIYAAGSLADLRCLPHVRLRGLGSDEAGVLRLSLAVAEGISVVFDARSEIASAPCASEVEWEGLTEISIVEIQNDSERSGHGN